MICMIVCLSVSVSLSLEDMVHSMIHSMILYDLYDCMYGCMVGQVHVCEVCGSEHVQWVGRCPTCKEWNCVKPFKVRREQGALFS